MWSATRPPLTSRMLATFAVSMTLPPPTPISRSQSCRCPRAAHSSTVAMVELGGTFAKVAATSMREPPASPRSTRAATPASASTWSVTSSALRLPSAANVSPARSTMPRPKTTLVGRENSKYSGSIMSLASGRVGAEHSTRPNRLVTRGASRPTCTAQTFGTAPYGVRSEAQRSDDPHERKPLILAEREGFDPSVFLSLSEGY